MLEPPDIPDELILARLQEAYALRAPTLSFLPLGADVNTAVYRAVSAGGAPYFLKLRKGDFDSITVEVPYFLHTLGLSAIIAPIPARSGRLWAPLDPYRMILYPFVDGKDGYQVSLTDRQWLAFGAAMRAIHAAQVPPDLARRIPRETYTPYWRNLVREYQAKAEMLADPDPVAARVAAVLRANRRLVTRLLDRAERLAAVLRERPQPFVLCHSDIHPGNLHLAPDGSLYIVDWDNPIFAPRERDLMLVGGSTTWHDPGEEALFYQGYGPVEIDPAALAYYRYERIIWDLAAYGEQLLDSMEGGQDREQSLAYFESNFLPGHEIEIAFQKDSTPL